MSRRKWFRRSLIACLVAGALLAAIHVVSQPGPDDPEWWLNRAMEEAYSLTDGPLSSGLLGGIAWIQARMGDISGAKRTAAGMTPPKATLLGKLVRKASAFLKRVGIGSGPAPVVDRSYCQPFAYAAILGIQAEAGDIAGAKATFELMAPPSFSVSMINFGRGAYLSAVREIVQAQVEAGDLCAAELFLESNLESEYSCIAPTIAVIACGRARAGDATSAKATADRLLSEEVELGGRETVYAAIATGLAEAGKIEEALSAARESYMALAFHAVVNAQLKAGDINAAKATVRSMAVGPWRDRACSGVVTALIKADKADEALAFARGMGDGYEERTYVAMCKAKASSGDIEGAKALARKTSSPWTKAAAICSIAQAQLAAGDVKGAHAVVDQCARTIGKAPTPPGPRTFVAEELARVYLSIAEAYAAAGDADGYSTCIEAAKRLTTFDFANIAETQARTGDLAGASETIDALRNLDRLEVIAPLRPNFAAQQSAGRGYAATHDDLDDLIRFIKALKDPLERGFAYLGAAEGLIQKQEEAKKQKGAQE